MSASTAAGPGVRPVADREHHDGRAPALERVGLGFRMTFESSQVELGISRIRESSSDLTGELRVRQVGGGFSRSVMPISSWNFKSVVARRTMAAALKDRLGSVPWADLLDVFAEQVLEQYRRRAQVHFIGDEPPQEALTEILPAPFISPATMHGPAGTGKTLKAIALAVGMQTGVEVIPGLRSRRPAPVLYLDYEDTLEAFTAQVRGVCRGAGVDPPRIAYMHMEGALSDQVEELAAVRSEHEIGVTILDSFEPGCGSGSEREGVNVRVHRTFDAMRAIGGEWLVLDHLAGADLQREGPSLKPIGGTAKLGRCRSMFELRAERDPAPDRIELAVIDTKRNRRSKVPTRGLAVTMSNFDEYGAAHVIRFEQCELTAPELVKKQSQREQVARLLRAHAMFPKEIAAELGIAESSVRTYASRDARIIKLQDGRLALRAV